MLELRRVTIRRAGCKVFSGTSWTIRAGQHWAVIGPNGSGKSTLLRALWGGWPLCAGEADYAFERTSAFRRNFYFSIPEEAVAHVGFAEQQECIRRHLGFFQERWYSGAEHEAPTVAAFLSWEAIRGITPFQVDAQPPDRARYHAWRRRAIRTMGLQALLPQPIHLLSNGEWRKVLIARVLMQSPAVLVLDDPFAGLDAASQARLQQHLVNLLRVRTPVVVMALSQPDQIPPGITRALLLHHERVVLEGRWPQVRRESAWRNVFSPQFSKRGERGDVAVEAAAGRKAGEASPVVVECRHISLRFGGRKIIQDLSWIVRAGEQWALVGPNGAGKSSLVGMLAGDVPQAYAQDIRLFGHPRGTGETVWQLKRKIGFYSPELLVQFPGQLTLPTVVLSGFFDTLGVYRRSNRRQRQSALRWIKRLKLSTVQRRPFYELSEGEQRLALVARALVKEPPLVILDEPFQNLDATHSTRLRHVLEKIARHGRTTLIVIVHRLADLPSTVTHLIQLEKGRVCRIGRR